HKELKALEKKLANDDIKQKYFFDNTSLYKEYATFVWRPTSKNPGDNRGEFRNINGRTIDVVRDAKLLNEYVLSDKNIIHGLKSGFKKQDEAAVIVTSKILEDLNYPPNAKYLYMQSSTKDTTQPNGFKD